MLINLLKWLGVLLNWSPIFHVSCDSDFGSFSSDMTSFRLSLITLSLGKQKFYLFTYSNIKSNRRFKLFYVLKLEQIQSAYNETDIETKVSDYKKLINQNNYNEEQIKLQIELLKEKLTQNRSIMSNFYTKLNSYRSILLASSAGGIYVFTAIFSATQVSATLALGIISIVLFTLYGISAFSQITYALQLKSIVKSKFKTLKEDTNITQLAVSFYVDFISSSNETTILATITKNTEKYFYRCILALGSAWLLTFASLNLTYLTIDSSSKSKNEFLVMGNQKEFNLKELSELYETLITYKGIIYVIGNKDNEKLSKVSDFIQFSLLKNQVIKLIKIENKATIENAVLVKLEE